MNRPTLVSAALVTLALLVTGCEDDTLCCQDKCKDMAVEVEGTIDEALGQAVFHIKHPEDETPRIVVAIRGLGPDKQQWVDDLELWIEEWIRCPNATVSTCKVSRPAVLSYRHELAHALASFKNPQKCGPLCPGYVTVGYGPQIATEDDVGAPTTCLDGYLTNETPVMSGTPYPDKLLLEVRRDQDDPHRVRSLLTFPHLVADEGPCPTPDSCLDGRIPPHVTVDHAWLSLYSVGDTETNLDPTLVPEGSDLSAPYELYQITTPWAAAGVSWLYSHLDGDGKGVAWAGEDGNPLDHETYPPSMGVKLDGKATEEATYVNFDITDALALWRASPDRNHGVLLTAANGVNSYHSCTSQSLTLTYLQKHHLPMVVTHLADCGTIPPAPPMDPPAPDAVDTPDVIGDVSDDPGPVTCESTVLAATEPVAQPVDILFLIDNSGSMDHTIGQVEDHINGAFADLIEASGLDYRVIMVTKHGTAGVGCDQCNICIHEPLSLLTEDECASTSESATSFGHREGRFYHYNTTVNSTDGWEVFLRSYDKYSLNSGDSENFTEGQGFRFWLRPEAQTHVLQFTDDTSDNKCTYTMLTETGEEGETYVFDDGFIKKLSFTEEEKDAMTADADALAELYHQVLTTIGEPHFGTFDAPTYRWHSIVGLESDGALTPEEAISWFTCDSGTGIKGLKPGGGYQALSRLTGGLRYALCSPSYGPIFEEVAQHIIVGQNIACQVAIPHSLAAAPHAALDLEVIGEGQTLTFSHVDSPDDCTGETFTTDTVDGGPAVILCPAACEAVKALTDPQFHLSYCEDDLP